MKRVIRNHFTYMRKIIVTTLCIACVLLCWSCKNDAEEEPEDPICEEDLDQLGRVYTELDKLISSNLLKLGDTDHDLLVGRWYYDRFAYTEDGIEVSNRVINEDLSEISGLIPSLIVPDPPHTLVQSRWEIGFGEDELWKQKSLWGLSSCNLWSLFCALSDNLIKLTYYIGTLAGCYHYYQENITGFAIVKAYSFVVFDEELIIYFEEKDNINLIIFKKNKQ